MHKLIKQKWVYSCFYVAFCNPWFIFRSYLLVISAFANLYFPIVFKLPICYILLTFSSHPLLGILLTGIAFSHSFKQITGNTSTTYHAVSKYISLGMGSQIWHIYTIKEYIYYVFKKNFQCCMGIFEPYCNIYRSE